MQARAAIDDADFVRGLIVVIVAPKLEGGADLPQVVRTGDAFGALARARQHRENHDRHEREHRQQGREFGARERVGAILGTAVASIARHRFGSTGQGLVLGCIHKLVTGAAGKTGVRR